MVECAIQSNEYFEVSDWEARKKEISFTTDTVHYFLHSKEWGKEDLFLIIGADCLLELETWKNPETILNKIPTLVIGRPNYALENAEERFRRKLEYVRTPHIELSSSDIRRRIKDGKSIRFLVTPQVEAFIQNKGLYR